MDKIWENLFHEFQTPFTNQVLVFSVILFIILLVPIIFNRFKVPGIIGLIISGMIIGPNGFNLIARSSAVTLFSTIGLLYIMFIAGLELDLGEFKKNRNKSIVFGILTFLVPILIGVPVCFYLLGYGFSSSLLIASMFATHTLIAYPIVNRLGIAKNQAVAVAVGGTILTDTAVLILLAVISGSYQTGLTSEFWSGLAVSLTVFLIVVVFVIPKISSWFFRRLADEKYAHFIYVLSVIFFCAFLAELSGLEPIIGAFAAGLTLNRLIPHTSSLMNRIEFVGNALFIPFFLISVGMLIDIQVLGQGSQALVVAFTLTGVALLAKWIAAHGTGMLFKYSKVEKNLIFGLSSAHAAATLAVILVGYNIGLIDEHVLNGTVVLILITCVVASLVTEKSGKELLIQMDAEPEQITSVQRVLVPISNPETMENLIDLASVIKNTKDNLPIIALTVVKDDDQAQAKLLQSKKLLDKAIIHAASADQQVEIMSTIDRNVTSGIKRIVKEKFITDLILGWSEEKTLADIIFGRTFDSLVKQTTQTLWITRFNAPLNIHRNLIVVCPVYAEKEVGFYKWLHGLLNTASHLRMRINMYCSNDIMADVNQYVTTNKFIIEIVHKGSVDYGSMDGFQKDVTQDDMIAFICSRTGGISYTPVLDILPRKMAKTFTSQNLVFIYPATTSETTISNYEEVETGGILEKSLNVLRNATRILKRD
ncbi:MAG TPA: cation:proton antiporter [Ohtaekwangia sp.]|nr:cation:proton antiporter [Ohtaekwangia sp.]